MAASSRASTAEEVWRVECGHVLAMELVEDQLFIRTTNDMRCIDRRDAREVWVTELRAQSEGSVPPALVLPSDSFIFVGDMAVAEGEPDSVRVLSFRGTEVVAIQVPGRLTAIQAMRRFIYAGTSEGVFAWHVR